ncbi:MAG: cyanophycinase [Geminicoccaceae bacterium]
MVKVKKAPVRPLPDGAKLAIIGGRFEEDNTALFAALHARAQGRIAILPTASTEPRDVGEETRHSFHKHGFECEVVPIHHTNARTTAFAPRHVQTIERLGSVYFTGGDQAHIVAAMVQNGAPTPVLEAIRRCWLAGGLVAGSSAGAAMMSDPMIMGGHSMEALIHPPVPPPHDDLLTLGKGLGFFPFGLVDQHFLQRGRLGRLVAALLATRTSLGFGIDENTGMLVEGSRIEVVGETGMLLVDVSKLLRKPPGRVLDEVRISYLDDGDSVDLLTRTVTPGPGKRAVKRSERYYRAPSRVGLPAFGAYTVTELMARLVEADTSTYRTEQAFAFDHASGTEIAFQVTRNLRSKVLLDTTGPRSRMTALDFTARFELKTASAVDYYRHRALPAMLDTAPGERLGRLVLIGSPLSSSSSELFDELRNLAQPIGVLATASSEPRAVGAETVKLLERHGVRAVDLGASGRALHSEEGRRALVERMAGIDSFLITGGNQRRLVDELLFRGEETAAFRAIVDARKRGATIVAMAGGAAALSPLMIAGGSSVEAFYHGVAPDDSHPGLLVMPGLGFFDAGILDQNIVASRRLGRLIVACAEEAVPCGFGLCEDTGLVVEPDRSMRVVGRQGVVLIEVEPSCLHVEDDVVTLRDVRLRLVAPGERIDTGHKVSDAHDGRPTRLTIEQLLKGLREEARKGLPPIVPGGRIRFSVADLADRSARLHIETSRHDA